MAGFIDTLFGGGAEKEAADKNRALLAQYQPDAMGYLKGSYDTGRGDIGQAISSYAPLSELAAGYNKGGALYQDALGINGPEGNARATGAFQNAPGYTGAVTAGLDVLNRRRATQGMAASGNADIDALTFGQNLQNQQYDSWLKNLQQSGQTGVGLVGQAAQGEAGGYTNLANLASQYGQNQVGVAGNVLSGGTNANNLQAAGEAAGAKNLLNAGLSVAGMVAGGPLGGMISGGLGSMGSALSQGASSGFGSSMGTPWQMANTGRWGSQYQGPVQ